MDEGTRKARKKEIDILTKQVLESYLDIHSIKPALDPSDKAQAQTVINQIMVAV